MNYEITMLKDGHPTARKEHECMFCGRIIRKGEKYHRSTFVYDDVYDWVECDKCEFVACELNMYDDCNNVDGLSADVFQENINEYVRLQHYDKSIDDIAKEWQLPFFKTVDKVYEELINKKEKEKNI